MKKILISILALIYLGSVSGVTLHMHYCMGELAGWGFWKDNSTHCGLCGMEKKQTDDSGCCTDEQKQVKADDDHKSSETSFQISKLNQKGICHTIPTMASSEQLSAIHNHPFSNAPPRSVSGHLYLIHCIFLI